MKVGASEEQKKDMINALQLIKDECVVHSRVMTKPSGGVVYGCVECSFYNKGECIIRTALPKYWSLADDDGDRTWRAFL